MHVRRHWSGQAPPTTAPGWTTALQTPLSFSADHLRAMFREMALRDSTVLEAIQLRLGEEVEPRRDVNVKADRAAIKARRVAQAMVEEEAGRTAPRPALR